MDIRINRGVTCDAPGADAVSLMPAGEVFTPAGSGDERRMQVRAYNHWLSLAAQGELPAIEDLRPEELADLGPNSVVLDLTLGRDNPTVLYIGSRLAAACGTEDIFAAGDVPSRSLLARLTEHGLEVVANRAPVGFDSEFVDARHRQILYRSILLPFSSNGRTIDFIFGVISWKEETEDTPAPAPEPADGAPAVPQTAAARPVPPAIQSLRDLLAAARSAAEEAARSEDRSRAALYAALGRAYDFALAAERDPVAIDRLIAEVGLPAAHPSFALILVKLVFGASYDKTRLSEYAALLDHARSLELPCGRLADWLAAQPGGVRAVVAEERRLRRNAAGKPEFRNEIRSLLQRKLRRLPALEQVPGSEEFVLLVARRDFAGEIAVLGATADPALVDRAARRLLAAA